MISNIETNNKNELFPNVEQYNGYSLLNLVNFQTLNNSVENCLNSLK